MAHAHPDLVLHGSDAGNHLRGAQRHEACDGSCKIVLWVNSISTELAFQAMGLGVRGILRKTLPTDLQVKCLQKVQAGELWFEKALTDSFLCARRVALTQREGQLVSLLSQGLKNKEIATTLMISEGTVKVYLSRLFQKVGVKDRFELALFGLKNLTTGQLPAGEKGPPRRPCRDLRSLVLERPAEFPSRPPGSWFSRTSLHDAPILGGGPRPDTSSLCCEPTPDSGLVDGKVRPSAPSIPIPFPPGGNSYPWCRPMCVPDPH